MFPWLWPYGGDQAYFQTSFQGAGLVSDFLNAQSELIGASGVPRFVPSTQALGALEYERCVKAGQIPTRDVSHDWYNGQVWLKFAQAKHFINACHVDEDLLDSAVQKSSNNRSRLRDAMTLFDESGALFLTTDPALSAALLSHDWKTLWAHRELWAHKACVLIVGHGLLDAMHRPYKGLCAKAVPVCVRSLDLTAEALQVLVLKVVVQIQVPANLSPLPVMGIPGWFRESSVPGFYDDTSVYRAKPTPRRSSTHERLAFLWDESTLSVGKCAGQSPPDC